MNILNQPQQPATENWFDKHRRLQKEKMDAIEQNAFEYASKVIEEIREIEAAHPELNQPASDQKGETAIQPICDQCGMPIFGVIIYADKQTLHQSCWAKPLLPNPQPPTQSVKCPACDGRGTKPIINQVQGNLEGYSSCQICKGLGEFPAQSGGEKHPGVILMNHEPDNPNCQCYDCKMDRRFSQPTPKNSEQEGEWKYEVAWTNTPQSSGWLFIIFEGQNQKFHSNIFTFKEVAESIAKQICENHRLSDKFKKWMCERVNLHAELANKKPNEVLLQRIDSLTVELAKANEEKLRLHRIIVNDEDNQRALIKSDYFEEMKAMSDEVKRLREAAKQFAHHHQGCLWWNNHEGCNCGISDQLKAALEK